jgi:ABC-type nitrate/sulfonate/bicarbonate transport system substrate-binding protein
MGKTWRRALSGFLCLAGTVWYGSAPAQSPQPLPVTVELGDVSLTKLPFIMAADNGIFEKNGLKVDMFITPRAAKAVVSAGVIVPPQYIRDNAVGEINIGGGSPTIVRMTTVADAPHRIILATMDDYSRFHILTRADITDPEQLKGKRLGFGNPGALDQLSFLLFVQKMGWDPVHDVTFLSDAANSDAVVKGEVDAFAGVDVDITAAKRKGLNDLVDLGKYRFAMPGSGVNVLTSWLPQHREETRRFMKATVEAIALAKTDREAAYASLRKWFGITDPVQLQAVYAQVQLLPSKPYPSLAGLKQMHKVYHWRALANAKPEDLADASFIRALDKSGYIDSLYKNKTK